MEQWKVLNRRRLFHLFVRQHRIHTIIRRDLNEKAKNLNENRFPICIIPLAAGLSRSIILFTFYFHWIKDGYECVPNMHCLINLLCGVLARFIRLFSLLCLVNFDIHSYINFAFVSDFSDFLHILHLSLIWKFKFVCNNHWMLFKQNLILYFIKTAIIFLIIPNKYMDIA